MGDCALKTVWVHAHVGSNPTPSANKNKGHCVPLVFIAEDFAMQNPHVARCGGQLTEFCGAKRRLKLHATLQRVGGVLEAKNSVPTALDIVF